jgi:uncharacterized protein YndB with AHSA1/START domain
MTAPNSLKKSSKLELTITRVFDAPRELVYQAWTDPNHMAKWSCPAGFTIFLGEMDVRPGGTYRCGMKSPKGEDHIVGGTYREVIKNECLVYTHTWESSEGEEPSPETLVTVIFEEENGKTKLTFHQEGFGSIESREGHKGGWTECFEKLNTLLKPNTKNKKMTAKNKSNEIHITRIYDAPVKLVWEAWTDPEQTAKWWGPRGFTLTTHGKDFKVGGFWAYTMHGPDGVDYPNKTIYHEIEKYSRLVYDHGGNDDRPPMFRVTVLFSEIKGKTKMAMTMALPTPEAAEETKKFIKKAGGNATWDRLAEFLEKETSDKDLFVINRSFEAPIETVFEVWTDPKHFSQWLAPTGFTMQFMKADIKEGGSTFYKMTDGGKVTMYGRAKYLEVKKPHRIVYTQQFCDEHENISRHPMAPTWPETMLTTVVLSEEGPNQTRVTVTWEVYGDAKREEIDTFSKAKGGMTQGWTGSFDKLEDYLAKIG